MNYHKLISEPSNEDIKKNVISSYMKNLNKLI